MSNDNWTELKTENPVSSLHNWTLIQGNDEDGLPMTLFAAIAFFVFILFAAMACGLIRLCQKEDSTPYEERPQYSVAISNRLFKDDTAVKDLPCLNCRLIEMGEMACYEETCPQCGQIPPSKKLLYEAYEQKKRQLEQKRKKQFQQAHAQASRQALQNVSNSQDSTNVESGSNGQSASANNVAITTAVLIQPSSTGEGDYKESAEKAEMDSKV